MNTPWTGKYGPLLIAEIGGNHCGDFEYAQRLTELAINSGVDYVKFQLYEGDTLVSRLESPDRNQHFKKFELSKAQYLALAEMCRASGVGYLASVWDCEYLDWIDDYISIYKIGSGDLTAYPVLSEVAKKRKPIILSTGLSTLDEVLDAIAYLQSLDLCYKDPNYLAVLQCTAMYPISNADANLAVIDKLKKITGLTVGYSDHTIGMKALCVAAAMGAQILEFHFTDRREGQWFRDHQVSLMPDEVKALQAEIAVIMELRGDGVKRPLECENENRISFRRAIYPSRDIKAGELLTQENLTTLRPNHGIDARDYDKVLHMRTRIDLQAHQKLEWEYLCSDGDNR